MPEPSESYDWATNLVNNGPSGGPNRIDPPLTIREQGYTWGSKSPVEYFNGWCYIVGLWLDYVRTAIDDSIVVTDDLQDQIDTINNTTIPAISETTSESFLIGDGTTNTNTKYLRFANDVDETTSYVALKWNGSTWDLIGRNENGDAEYNLDPSSYGYQTQAQVETLIATEATKDSGVGVALLRDEKASGTDGGSNTSGVWQTRDLNTEVYDPNSVVSALAANRFTLVAGQYVITTRVPAFRTRHTQSRLVEDPAGAATVVDRSMSIECSNNDAMTGVMFMETYVTIASATVYEVQMRGSDNQGGTAGMGKAASTGEGEVYTMVKINRIGDN